MPHTEPMLASKQTEFFLNCRTKGVPPLKVPVKVVEPEAEKERLAVANKQLSRISKDIDHSFQESTLSFDSLLCKETFVEEHGHLKSWKKVCILCAEKK